MTFYFFQIGVFPDLSLNEIAHVFPQQKFSYLSESKLVQLSFLQEEHEGEIVKKFGQMGGVLRWGKPVCCAEDTPEILRAMMQVLQQKYQKYQKKIRFGISFSGKQQMLPRQELQLLRSLLKEIKANAREQNISVRFINRNFQNIDTATAWKERLYAPENIEFVLAKEGQKRICMQCVSAQNPEEFAQRDYGKPVRDMQVGMTPPKLALMMLNFARNEKGELPHSVWDPFCGTGTFLLEAKRLGMSVFGSDISDKMVSASRANMQYFFDNSQEEDIFQHDVTQKLVRKIFPDVIVSEGFLGPIFSEPISSQKYQQIEQQITQIYEGFFFRVTDFFQGTKIILSFPFWKGQQGRYFYLEKVLETAHKLGYTTQDFLRGTKRGSLEFMRPEQVVGREIFCFTSQR